MFIFPISEGKMSEDSPSIKAAEPEAKVSILTYNLAYYRYV